MQILHPFVGSVQQYFQEIADPDRYRPDHCPLCDNHRPLTAHGFYSRTLVDVAFDGVIRVRRYLCRCCKRTVSLLPDLALPYLRFGIAVIALFLIARLLLGRTLGAAAVAATLPNMPYQRGQFWVRRFRQQAERLCAGAGGVGHSPACSGLHPPRLAHAPVHRLDRRPPVPVCRPAMPPVGLAGVSRSSRAGGRAPPLGAAHLRPHTQLLPGAGDASGLCFWLRRSSPWMPKAEKIALFRFGAICVAGAGTVAAW